MVRHNNSESSVPKKPRYVPLTIGERFNRFATNAKLPLFEDLKLVLSGSEIDCNDSLFIPHYEPNAHTFSGKQRRGIVQTIDSATSYNEHIGFAERMQSPLSIDTPIPSDLGEVIDLIANNEANLITGFWESQLADFEVLSGKTRLVSDEWYKQTHPKIAPATGHINAALLAFLIQALEIGDQRWPSQFIHGFPLTGYICQSGVFPLQQEPLAELADPSALFLAASKRFLQRSKASHTPHRQYMWDETIKEQRKGWFNPPRKLNASGLLLGNLREPINPTFRFPIQQADKIRLIDDLKHSEVNRYTLVGSPITLPTWDLLVELCLRVIPSSHDWPFGEVGHSAAYKNLPLFYRDQQYVSIVARNPSDNAFYAFPPTTQLFGSTASALHYNVLSRLLVVILVRVFAIPAIGYYGDYGFLVPSSLAGHAMRVVRRVCLLLGIELKDDKCRVANKNNFLGLTGIFPCRDNNFTLTISLTPGKSLK